MVLDLTYQIFNMYRKHSYLGNAAIHAPTTVVNPKVWEFVGITKRQVAVINKHHFRAEIGFLDWDLRWIHTFDHVHRLFVCSGESAE